MTGICRPEEHNWNSIGLCDKCFIIKKDYEEGIRIGKLKSETNKKVEI